MKLLNNQLTRNIIGEINKELGIFIKTGLFEIMPIIPHIGRVQVSKFCYKVLHNGLNDDKLEMFKLDHIDKTALFYNKIGDINNIIKLKLDKNNNYMILYLRRTSVNDYKVGMVTKRDIFYIFIGPKSLWYKNKVEDIYKRKIEYCVNVSTYDPVCKRTYTKQIPPKTKEQYFGMECINNLMDYLYKFANNETEKLYRELGKIYKTGILLHGEPGTGKSSLATVIATELKIDIVIINTDNILSANLSDLSSLRVVLIDEIDRFFKKNPSEEEQKRINKLLTILDSPDSPSNVIFVATTNNFKNLSDEMIRDGRFDFIKETNNISKEDAIQMAKSMKYPLRLLKDETFPINPSYLQNKITQYRVKKLFETKPKEIK